MVELALSLDDEIIVAIRRVSQAVDRYSRFLWQGYGLTAPQLGTLREIQKLASASPSVLAERLHISAPTMAGILKRLEQRGLVSRVRDEHDRRSFVVRITKDGKELAAQAPSLLRDQFREKLNEMALWERSQLLAMLQRTAEMMNAEEVEEAPFLYNDTSDTPRAPVSPDSSGQTGSSSARRGTSATGR
jgi:DNA-binding MarR family transcriptional regulator